MRVSRKVAYFICNQSYMMFFTSLLVLPSELILNVMKVKMYLNLYSLWLLLLLTITLSKKKKCLEIGSYSCHDYTCRIAKRFEYHSFNIVFSTASSFKIISVGASFLFFSDTFQNDRLVFSTIDFSDPLPQQESH